MQWRKYLYILVLILFSSSASICAKVPSLIEEYREEIQSYDRLYREVSHRALFLGAGTVLSIASIVSGIGGGISFLIPGCNELNQELFLFSNLSRTLSFYAFQGGVSKLFETIHGQSVLLSEKSWTIHQENLKEIPTHSEQEQKFLSFLGNHFLAKGNGFYRGEVDFGCRSFNIPIQVHPKTTNCYARDPATQSSAAYTHRLESWKKNLPHPARFPLVLTRPHNVEKYLPNLLKLASLDELEQPLQRLQSGSQLILDLSLLLSNDEDFTSLWEALETKLLLSCERSYTNPSQIVCIQTIQNQSLGGIRILPLKTEKEEETEIHSQEILKWIALSGLTPTLVELDRWNVSLHLEETFEKNISDLELQSVDRDLSWLDSFTKSWVSTHPQKKLMVDSFIHALRGLFKETSDKEWSRALSSRVRMAIFQLSIKKIEEEFSLLLEEDPSATFFETVSHVESMYAYFLELLEIFSPFRFSDFDSIYKTAFKSIPNSLKPYISCGLHASCMTSLTGTINALSKTLKRSPRIMYGKNTYFESIHMVEQMGNAIASTSAQEKDWGQIDLLIAQFNPVLKRDGSKQIDYTLENVEGSIRKIFAFNHGEPLTVFLDATLEYIDSFRVNELLQTFEEEIMDGRLLFICSRSGVKFDLLGMDQYAGAPIFMIYSSKGNWDSFQTLIRDPAICTDKLSYNWFCLAYKYLTPFLEEYRKQIFLNTKRLLDEAPAALYKLENRYRLVPFEEGILPAFIDIRTEGFMHKVKAAVLVGGALYLRCMEAHHPIFYRRSLGLYHPNFSILFGHNDSTIRLTVGLDPGQVDVLLASLQEIIDTQKPQ